MAAHATRTDASRLNALLSTSEHVLPYVFSFLSVVELYQCERVNRTWQRFVALSRTLHIRRLDLGQLWSSLGAADVEASGCVALVRKFERIDALSLGYCNHATDEAVLQLVRALPRHEDQLQSLDLFFCYRLTDAGLAALLREAPRLVSINLGRCLGLTARSLGPLGALPALQRLGLSHLALVDAEALHKLAGGEGAFPALRFVDLDHCAGVAPAAVQHMLTARPELELFSSLQPPKKPRAKKKRPPQPKPQPPDAPAAAPAAAAPV